MSSPIPPLSPKALGKRRATFEPLAVLHPSQRGNRRSHHPGFSYSTPLVAHHACINTLALSPNDGEFLASAGDDEFVLLWNVYGRLDGAEPVASYLGSESNVFTLAFSCDSTKLFSAGNDERIRCHDIETGSSTNRLPYQVWNDHDAGVRSIAAHPNEPFIFMSASEDGTVRRFDTRVQGETGILLSDTSFNSVVHNPVLPQQFATADEEGTLLLHDARMAFTKKPKDARDAAVLQYTTMLQRAHPNALLIQVPFQPEVSSITFDPSGKLLTAIMMKGNPTLYSISDPAPLATFSTPQGADGSGYSNLCTVKNGSFGGTPGNLFYSAGSEDDRAYVWAIPDLELLRERRKEINKSNDSTIEGGPALLSATIDTPSSILYGHRAIVNVTLFHPRLPLLFTSGVEKVVFAHSPTALGPSSTSSPNIRKREEPTGEDEDEDYWDGEPEDESTREGETPTEKETRLRKEDPKVLKFFDSIVAKARRKFALGEEGSDTEDEEDEDYESDSEYESDGVLYYVPSGEDTAGMRMLIAEGTGEDDVDGEGEGEGEEAGDDEDEDEVAIPLER